MPTAYITVSTRDGDRLVQAYLYEHTKIVGHAAYDVAFIGRRNYFLLETSAGTEEEAQRLALYQSDRLASSGSMAAAMSPTRAGAEKYLWDLYQVAVDPVKGA